MKRTALAVLLAGALAAPAWSQEDGDAPDQGVARLSLMSGDVTIRRGDSGELVAAETNAPLVALDHVLTGPGSRAEIQFDYANMIRLAPASEVRLGELEDRSYLVQVASGTTTFRVLRDSSALVEISTPTVSVRPVERGTYRVMVRPDGSTQVTVRDGRAEIFTQRGSEILRDGQTMEARGTASDPEYMISSAIGRDDWDRWNQTRDNDLERSQSYRYVSRDIYGADDLDGYGRWVYDSPYGWVWVPSVAAGWAPYRVGRWTYLNYYGWTWLSGDPWGWAPYHYGNWYSSSYGWAWYPGVVGPRYYWRPAIVGFFGWGSGSISIGFGNSWGFGNIGWVPLAPYEVYRPWYGRGFRNTTVVNNVTVVNNTNITNVFRNARNVNGRIGVTSVQSGKFGRERVDVNNFVQVNNRDLNRAGQVRGQLPFEGNAQSRRFSDRNPGFTPIAARANGDQSFVTRPDRAGRNSGPAARVGVNQPANSLRQGNNPAGQRQGNNSVGTAVAPSIQNNTGNRQNNGGFRRFDPQADNTPGTVLQQRDGGGTRSEPRNQGAFPRMDGTNNAGANPNANRNKQQPFVTAPRNQGVPNANSNVGTAPQINRNPRVDRNDGGNPTVNSGANPNANRNTQQPFVTAPRTQGVPNANSNVGTAPQINRGPRVDRNDGGSPSVNAGANRNANRNTQQPFVTAPRNQSVPNANSNVGTAPRVNRSPQSGGGGFVRAPSQAPRPNPGNTARPNPARPGGNPSGAVARPDGNSGGVVRSGNPGGGGGPAARPSGGPAARINAGGGGGGPAARPSGNPGGGGGAPRGNAGGGASRGGGGGARGRGN